MSNITVSVSTDNVVMQEYSESPGQTMSDLMSALATIKTRTNEYLTELVEASKSQAKAGTGQEDLKNKTTSASDANSTRPSVVVVPEKKAKV